MITVYQEQIPFSNKRLDQQISKDSVYTNPIIMPFAFNSTSSYNSLETVIYIRNNDPSKYYTGIVVCLMTGNSDDTESTGTVYVGNKTSTLNLPTLDPFILENAYEGVGNGDTVILEHKYKAQYTPISKTSLLEAKFSYGYDELSNYMWSERKSGLYIPYIGNSSLYDMSYIPVRMRINFYSEPSLFTIRDYFIDVSYAEELEVTG